MTILARQPFFDKSIRVALVGSGGMALPPMLPPMLPPRVFSGRLRVVYGG